MNEIFFSYLHYTHNIYLNTSDILTKLRIRIEYWSSAFICNNGCVSACALCIYATAVILVSLKKLSIHVYKIRLSHEIWLLTPTVVWIHACMPFLATLTFTGFRIYFLQMVITSAICMLSLFISFYCSIHYLVKWILLALNLGPDVPYIILLVWLRRMFYQCAAAASAYGTWEYCDVVASINEIIALYFNIIHR